LNFKITNFILSFFAYLITTPFIIIWLLFCAVLALIALVLPKKDILIDLNKVKKKETICKVLNNKGLISDKEYSFETNEVAILYDETTFRGYLFILKPIIVTLKYTNFLDGFISYLAFKWMAVHTYKKEHNREAKTLFWLLSKISVAIAKLVGTLLYRVLK
jgi:hypothetical protein